jgi:predicted choloylglycine hydrolase
MSEFSVDVIQLRDTSFNIGLKLGTHLHNTPQLHVFESTTRPEIDFTNLKSIFTTFAPHLQEELEGLAHGLEISTEKSAALFSGYDLPKTETMGCTALITKKYYVRNYDFTPDLYDGMFSLIQPDGVFASAGYNLQVVGRHDGVNEKGVVAGLHFVSNEGYSKGISPWTAVRMVLDKCSSVDDAIHMLKELPHSACYNFSLGDKKGSMAVVEASPGKVAVRLGESLLSCVNHFQDPALTDKNRSSIDCSVKRNSYLQEMGAGNFTHFDVFNDFKRKQSPLFFTDYEELFGTLHTFSYSFQNSRIMTAIAQSDQVLDIDFEEWVNGRDLKEQVLRGIVD